MQFKYIYMYVYLYIYIYKIVISSSLLFNKIGLSLVPHRMMSCTLGWECSIVCVTNIFHIEFIQLCVHGVHWDANQMKEML